MTSQYGTSPPWFGHLCHSALLTEGSLECLADCTKFRSLILWHYGFAVFSPSSCPGTVPKEGNLVFCQYVETARAATIFLSSCTARTADDRMTGFFGEPDNPIIKPLRCMSRKCCLPSPSGWGRSAFSSALRGTLAGPKRR